MNRPSIFLGRERSNRQVESPRAPRRAAQSSTASAPSSTRSSPTRPSVGVDRELVGQAQHLRSPRWRNTSDSPGNSTSSDFELGRPASSDMPVRVQLDAQRRVGVDRAPRTARRRAPSAWAGPRACRRGPCTITTASSAELVAESAIVFGKTITSIDAWRSSRTKTAIRSPFLVHFRWRLVTTPPTVRCAPSSTRLEIGERAVGPPAQAGLGAHERVVATRTGRASPSRTPAAPSCRSRRRGSRSARRTAGGAVVGTPNSDMTPLSCSRRRASGGVDDLLEHHRAGPGGDGPSSRSRRP